MGIFCFSQKETGPKVLPWQQHNWCHSVVVVMYIAGAKFEDYWFNISRDILD